MADLLFVVIVVVFFAVAALYVKACDRIIGPDGDRGAAVEGVASDEAGVSAEPTIGAPS